MDRATIIARLRAHEPELRRMGVLHIALFGSHARGDADTASDIDLLTALDETKALSLLDVIHIENRLSDALGRKVDLVDDASLDPRIRPAVQKTLVHAF